MSVDISTTIIYIIAQIGSNQIGDEGAEFMAAALVGNRSLATLNISMKSHVNTKIGCNEIRAKGAEAMGDALKENDALTSLDMGKYRLNKQAKQ